MKVRCTDGKVRSFTVADSAWTNGASFNGDESICEHCHHKFGIHDTKILKPIWKKHTCPLTPQS